MKLIFSFVFLLLLWSCRKDDYSNANFGFTKTFGGDNDEDVKKVLLIDNNIYIFGTTKSFGDAGGDFYLLKTDTLGTLIYQKQFENPLAETGINMITTNDNNLLLVGTSIQNNNRNIKVLKCDLEGNIIWQSLIEKNFDENIGGVVETLSGDFCLAATKKQPSGFNDIYLIWLTSDGTIFREKTYGGNLSDGAMDILNVNADLMVLGYTNSYGAGGQDFILLKINNQGDSLWANTYGGSQYEESQEFVQLDDGSFIINGHSSSTDPNHNMLTVKTNANGQEIWSKNFGGNQHDGGEAILLRPNGHIMLVGRSRSFGNGERNIYLVEINQNGMVLSEKSILTPSDDWATSITELNHYYYIVGKTKPVNSNKTDAFLLKIKV